MSRSIDLFIDAPGGLADVASDLTRATGTELVPDPDAPVWILARGEVVAELSEHRFGNDRNLLLKQYRYCLSARVPADGTLERDGEEVTTLRHVQAAIKDSTRFRSLLVWDLQHRLDQHDGDQVGEAVL